MILEDFQNMKNFSNFKLLYHYQLENKLFRIMIIIMRNKKYQIYITKYQYIIIQLNLYCRIQKLIEKEYI